MHNTRDKFELTYNLALIQVEKLLAEGSETYGIHFSNEVPDITIAFTKQQGAVYKWDTVPPGQTELAMGIGMLIEQYKNDRLI